VATVAVSFDGTNLSLAQSETDGGTWDKYQASQSPTQETDFVFNGTTNISNKVSNTNGGLEFEDGATVDFTTPRVVLAKVYCTTPGVIDETVAKGMAYEVGEGVDGGTGYYSYYLAGLYAGSYPLLKNWRVIAIDPNEAAYRDAVTGTVTLSTIDWYGLYVDITAIIKSENLIHARLDYMTSGAGLTLVGGDGASTDGTFQDFLDWDFETSTRRMAIVLPGDAEIIVNGVLTIGSATATVFNDSNKFLVFPHHLVAEGFCGVDIGMSNASNDIDFTACIFKGLGKTATKKFFDTALEVDGTNDEVDMTAHGFETGDLVTYSNEGGADNIGLTTATNYFVRAVTADSLSFYAIGATVGRQNSFTDTSKVNLTAAGAPGENHSLILVNDTRPDHTVTGTTGVGVDWTACTIDVARIITLTSKATYTGGFILNTGNITLGGGTLSGVSISAATTTEGDALVDTSDLAGVADCTLTAGDEGHAVEIDTAGNYSYSGNTHTGYGPDRAQFHTITGVDAATEVITTKALHGFTTGDAVYYDNHGGPDTVGLTSGNKYYVNAVSTSTLTIHQTRAAAVAGSSDINLSDGTAGEIHSLYSAKAALLNSASATLVDSYAPSNQSADEDLSSAAADNQAVGQGFTGNGGILSRCRFYLRKVGSPTGNATAKLYAHTGTFGSTGTPTGSALATSKDFDVSTLETTFAMVDFEFDDRVTMTNTTKYFIICDYSGGDATNRVEIGMDDTTPTHGGNQARFKTSTWNADDFADVIFYVYSGGEVIVNITGGGDTPTYRNSGSVAGVTIVNNAVTLTFEAVDNDDAAIQSVQVSVYAIDNDSELLLQDTNASGIATGSYSGTTPRDIYYRYRKASTGATKYVNLSGFATIESGTGVTVKRNMREDTIADPTI